MKLAHLSPGERFTIPSLRNFMTDLVVLRPSSSSVLVQGSEKRECSGWRGFRDYLAPTTEVDSLGIFEEIVPDATGRAQIKVTNSPITPHETGIVVIKTRSRNKTAITFPDGEFSIKSLAEKLGVPYHTVMNEFNRNRVMFRQVKSVPNGGKGKPITIWEKK